MGTGWFLRMLPERDGNLWPFWNQEWPTGGDGDQFPILDTEWRIEGAIDPEAYRFLEVADAPFSGESAQQVVRAGTKHANNYEDVRHAARQVQEIHMGEISVLAQNEGDLLAGDPELVGQIARIREVGALPYYGGTSAGNGRASGLPYDESKTHLAASNLWRDVRKGRVLVAHDDAISAETPIIPTPTATVAKKLPDRAISTDVRIISDLRLANLFCDRENYQEIHLSDIDEIASRDITIKRTWPNAQVVCCKRDIDAASNRVRTRRDMRVLLRAEFSGRYFEIDGNILFSHIAIPFRWRCMPAYFSCV